MGNYLALPAVGYQVATPHTTAMNPGLTPLDMRIKLALDDWAPAIDEYLYSLWTSGNAPASQYLMYLPGGVGGNMWSIWVAATGGAQQFGTAGAAPGVTSGQVKWLRMLVTPAAGTVSYYKSDDGSSWTQVGTTYTGLDTSGIQVTANTAPAYLRVGEMEGGGTVGQFTGRIYRAMLLVNSVLICDMDFTLQTPGANNTTFTATTGETWTITGPAIIVAESTPSRRSAVRRS